MSQDNQRFKSLSSEDVVSVPALKLEDESWNTTTFTVDELRNKIPVLFDCDSEHAAYQWCDAGIEGKVLFAEKGGGWKTGRIRLSIEFLPDVPDQNIDDSLKKASPELDEFR